MDFDSSWISARLTRASNDAHNAQMRVARGRMCGLRCKKLSKRHLKIVSFSTEDLRSSLCSWLGQHLLQVRFIILAWGERQSTVASKSALHNNCCALSRSPLRRDRHHACDVFWLHGTTSHLWGRGFLLFHEFLVPIQFWDRIPDVWRPQTGHDDRIRSRWGRVGSMGPSSNRRWLGQQQRRWAPAPGESNKLLIFCKPKCPFLETSGATAGERSSLPTYANAPPAAASIFRSRCHRRTSSTSTSTSSAPRTRRRSGGARTSSENSTSSCDAGMSSRTASDSCAAPRTGHVWQPRRAKKRTLASSPTKPYPVA